MATKQATSSDTEGQRSESVATSDMLPDVAHSATAQTAAAPDAATSALRDFVRALARAAARRDWADASKQQQIKGNMNESTDDGLDRG
jgi:hypothetical protein